MPLKPRHARFVREYLKDLNAKQAYQRTYEGTSDKTAETNGSRLLRFAQVKAAVEAGLARRNEKVEVQQADVLRELLVLSQLDPAEACDAKGKLLPIQKMPEHVRRAIVGMEFGDDGKLKRVRFDGKRGPLELLGKHLRLWSEKLEVVGRVTVEELITAAIAKPEGK